jgi:hypothetical protein
VRGSVFSDVSTKIRKKSKYGVYLVERISYYAGRDPITVYHVCDASSFSALRLGAPLTTYAKAVDLFQTREEELRRAA